MIKNLTSSGFTLIEILAGVTIVVTVTVSGFYAINTVGIGKIKLVEKTQLEQQAFFFSERLFEMVKQSGTIDYEGYFARRVKGNTSYLSGHYDSSTGFGNGSTSMVYCLSGNGSPMGIDGCITSHNSTGASMVGNSIIYGQYAEQFVDYNSDQDGDGGDEDNDGSIIGDDDDKFLGDGPLAIDGGGSVSEIYLINSDETERTYFRLFVSLDPDAPATVSCDFTDPQYPVGAGCLGTIQFLKLQGVDWGHDHSLTNIDATQNDGITDTWLYDTELYGLATDTVADLNIIDSEDYWLPIFSDGIDVESFEVFAYPIKDSNLAWADSDVSTFISPYLRLSMNLTPSWGGRSRIQGKAPEIQINTTINLDSNL